jgi:hypothetical protein
MTIPGFCAELSLINICSDFGFASFSQDGTVFQSRRPPIPRPPYPFEEVIRKKCILLNKIVYNVLIVSKCEK